MSVSLYRLEKEKRNPDYQRLMAEATAEFSASLVNDPTGTALHTLYGEGVTTPSDDVVANV